MKELLHDDDIMAEGIELGRTEGIELGRTEGIELGRTEGIELGRTEGIEIGRTQGLADGIVIFIKDKLEDGINQEVILQRLMKNYSLTKEEAEDYLHVCR